MNRLPHWVQTISCAALEQQIATLPAPVFEPVPSGAQREHPWLPRYARVFDDLCSLWGSLPSQVAYGGFYLARLQTVAPAAQTVDWRGLYARALRNYPAFVREYHLFVLIQDWLRHHHPDLVLVVDDLWDDLGADGVFADRQGRYWVGYRSYVGTKRGVQRAYGKRHLHRTPLPLFDLVLTPENADTLNGYWLYPAKPTLAQVELALDTWAGREEAMTVRCRRPKEGP